MPYWWWSDAILEGSSGFSATAIVVNVLTFVAATIALRVAQRRTAR